MIRIYRTLAVALVAAVLWIFAGTAGSASTFTKLTYLKFSGAVTMPRATLPAGEYAFELANPDGQRNAVKVSNRDRSKVYGIVLTRTTSRPVNLSSLPTVTLGEGRPGVPPPIKAWFPAGESTGYEFIY